MIIAIDTGGTKTLIASFDTEGAKQQIARFATPAATDEYIDSVVAAIDAHVEADSCIVVAVPGWMRDGVIEQCPNLGWSNFDIIATLQSHFPEATILLENDAELAGLSEVRIMETAPALSMYITISTGIGGGLAYHGELAPITARFEPGKAHLLHDDKPTRWEAFASGRAFYETNGKYGHDVDDPETWRKFAELVARGLIVHIPTFMPDTVIIGGSMGTHFAKYQQYLLAALERDIPQYMAHTAVIQAKHPEEAVIYGCYYYAIDVLADR